MGSVRALRLIQAVERELGLHKQLLFRLKLGGLGRSEQPARARPPKPSSGRFWKWVLPENAFDLYEEMKIAAQLRRELVRQISGNDEGWSLPRTLISLADDDAERLGAVKREFGAVAAAIAEELRRREEGRRTAAA